MALNVYVDKPEPRHSLKKKLKVGLMLPVDSGHHPLCGLLICFFTEYPLYECKAALHVLITYTL